MSFKDGKRQLQDFFSLGAAFPTRMLSIPRADAWPSSAAFDAISSALSDDAERKDAIKKGGAIFAFTLKNSKGESKDWHVDLKEGGKVGNGLCMNMLSSGSRTVRSESRC